LAEPASEHGAGFPPFESHTFAAQILWLAIAFGLLYYLMAKVALPRIQAILHDRAHRLTTDFAEAQRMKTEADAAGAAYEKSLADARAQAKGIAQATRDTLAAEADGRRKALEADLHDKMAQAEVTIRAGTQAAMANVRGIAGETAGAIIERLTGQAPEAGALDAALDRAMTAR
jgi:F-type H+-transporting ATPase subunit b